MLTSLHLATKEIWRNKGRFLLISLVIALITTLVLFIAGLAEGLASGQKEYIEKLDVELLVYQDNVDLTIPSSRIGRSKINDVRRVEGVQDVGPIGFASSVLVQKITADGSEVLSEPLDISLIGVEPDKPGESPVLEGRTLSGKRVSEAIIDQNMARQSGLKVGDRFIIKTIQGTLEKYHTLEVVGITDGRRYAINPSILVPYLTWNEIRPKATVNETGELTSNILAVKLDGSSPDDVIAERLVERVTGIEVTDLETAYQSIPGYRPQQSTLSTQRIFTLLIGLLVIGGFFQIQTLQKVAQVGVLKAIGAPNTTVVIVSVVQIILITTVGVAIGSAGTLALALNFPVTIPIIFSPPSVIAAVCTLLLIGPIGGLISIRTLLKVEPLTALGLAQ